MDFLDVAVKGLVITVLLGPALLLALGIFVLVPLALIQSRPRSVSRVTFECPVSRRRVTAAFTSSPETEHPDDVLSCSLFGDGPVTCRKGCTNVAVSHWGPSTMMPRFALLSDGEAYRNDN